MSLEVHQPEIERRVRERIHNGQFQMWMTSLAERLTRRPDQPASEPAHSIGRGAPPLRAYPRR
jgi:hypothetical protein